MRKLAVVCLSLVAAFSSMMPAQAFPSFNRPTVQASDGQLIQYRRYYGRNFGRGWGGYRNYGRNYGGWGGYRNYGGNYYGGYRPYGGYRYGRYGGYYGRGYYGGGYNDFGLLFGGLGTGAIIGGMLAQPRYYYDQPRYYGNSHAGWCYSRYRSYRAYDNTFQPYYGPRRQCIGPY